MKAKDKNKLDGHCIEIFSYWSLVKLVFFRFILIIGLCYCAYNYKQNPIAGLTLFTFCLLLLLASGMDKIKIYETKFECISSSLIGIFQKKRVFFFNEIENIEIDKNVIKDFDISDKLGMWNKIYIQKKTELIVVRTHLSYSNLKRFEIFVKNKLLKN